MTFLLISRGSAALSLADADGHRDLAWVQSRPGVTSTIIGARTIKQLDSNLAALDLPLSTDHVGRLDKLPEPKLNFPAQYLKVAPNFSNAGATVNGIESVLLPSAPKDLEVHY